MKNGAFIVFEGIDGSGKGTQLSHLAAQLDRLSLPYERTCEPTGSAIGSLVRDVLTGRVRTDNLAVAALFAADRLDHILDSNIGLLARLSAGTNVLCDRYYFSSYAYHSVDVPMDWVITTNEQAAKLLRPTVTVFIDIPAEEAMRRIHAGRTSTELFENEERLRKTRENYFTAFERMKDCERVIVIDGCRSEQEIADDIWEQLRDYFI